MLLQPKRSTVFLSQLGFKEKEILFVWAFTYIGSKSFLGIY